MHLDENIQKEANRGMKIALGFFGILIFSWILLLILDSFVIGNNKEASGLLIILAIILFYIPLSIAVLIYAIIKLIHMYGYTEYELNIPMIEFIDIIKSMGFSEKSSKYIKKVGINQFVMIEIVNHNNSNIVRLASTMKNGSLPFKICKTPLGPRYNNMTYFYAMNFFSNIPINSLTFIK